jgi:hypothetical protein
MYPSYWGQHFRDRLALQIQQASARFPLLQASPDDSERIGTAHHQQYPLPCEPTHQRRTKHGVRPPELRRKRPRIFAPLSSRFPIRQCSNPAIPLSHTTVDSRELRHLTTAQRDFLLSHSGSANDRIILDSKQEASHEVKDRVWRRWITFCSQAGLQSNPFLIKLQHRETELIMRSFLSLYRVAHWSKAGALLGQRTRPVVSKTVRDASSNLAAAFRSNFKQSPIHFEGSSQLLPTIRCLLKAFDNADPPPKRQKAITPKLLRYFFKLLASGPKNKRFSAYAHTADLTLGSFFFAMRSCEYTKTAQPGRTKKTQMGCIIFRTMSRRVLKLSDPDLLLIADYVTIVFIDQKNGKKMDARTQMRSGHPYLCPVLRWGSAVQRIIATIPNWNDQTTLCSVLLDEQVLEISNVFVRKLLRHTCYLFGGFDTFGFHPHEIGNKSIRSGAAMSLFLMDHSPAKIMILGRWSSDAFLVYIRPQVLEWTHNMSWDMIHLDSFFDASHRDLVAPSDPRTRKRLKASFNGRDSVVTIPKFYMHH